VSKFFFFLWLRWAIRVTIGSLLFAGLFTFFAILFIYVMQEMPELNEQIYKALGDIFKFYFPIIWSVLLLITLFRELKNIFNRCINGYKLELLRCKTQEVVMGIGYRDLLRVWRKWLMFNVWLIAVFVIFVQVAITLFVGSKSLFSWFDIYTLFGAILLSGYLSLFIMSSKCKNIKISRC
jgi:hypothetical protein